jgi:hypothetical protein
MKPKESRWTKWQRGQALMEYWPTIPASIIIMLMASGIATWFNKSILQTVDYLNPTDLRCEQKVDEEEGPETAYLDCHTIQATNMFYDEVNDQTTVGYKVTNGCEPDISHWVLGFPPGLADKILASSEKYEWVEDPNTGVAGLKFDIPYGKGKKTQALDGLMLASRSLTATTSDSRTVLLTMAGHYDWSITEVTIKAGTETYHSTITAPVAIYQGTDDECGLEE